MTSVLQDWIEHVFGHSVSKSKWYWSADAEQWAGPREQIPLFFAETFERGGELLAGFSDEQLDQGFSYLLYAGPPAFMQTLVDEEFPVEWRHLALRSFVPLFEQVMAVRCTLHLSHLDEKGANPLNSACYMWWDLLRDTPLTDTPSLSSEIIATLRLILAIPHDACRESALHGIGHLRRNYPEYQQQLSAIIDEFLAGVPGLRPELQAYAEQAREGNVL